MTLIQTFEGQTPTLSLHFSTPLAPGGRHSPWLLADISLPGKAQHLLARSSRKIPGVGLFLPRFGHMQLTVVIFGGGGMEGGISQAGVSSEHYTLGLALGRTAPPKQ